MSDFLTSLATRVLSPANVLQPRPASRFEPIAVSTRHVPAETIWRGGTPASPDNDLQRHEEPSPDISPSLDTAFNPSQAAAGPPLGQRPLESAMNFAAQEASSSEVTVGRELNREPFPNEVGRGEWQPVRDPFRSEINPRSDDVSFPSPSFPTEQLADSRIVNQTLETKLGGESVRDWFPVGIDNRDWEPVADRFASEMKGLTEEVSSLSRGFNQTEQQADFALVARKPSETNLIGESITKSVPRQQEVRTSEPAADQYASEVQGLAEEVRSLSQGLSRTEQLAAFTPVVNQPREARPTLPPSIPEQMISTGALRVPQSPEGSGALVEDRRRSATTSDSLNSSSSDNKPPVIVTVSNLAESKSVHELREDSARINEKSQAIAKAELQNELHRRSRDDQSELKRAETERRDAPTAESILARLKSLSRLENSVAPSASSPPSRGSSGIRASLNDESQSERASTAPTVQIRIGRIEVRANAKGSKAGGASRLPAQQKVPAASLAEYLRHQAWGAK